MMNSGPVTLLLIAVTVLVSWQAFANPRLIERRGTGIGHIAVGADQIFVEVPARAGALAQFVRCPPVERMRLWAGNDLLFGQREVYREVDLAEVLDLLGTSRLLPAVTVSIHPALLPSASCLLADRVLRAPASLFRFGL